MEIVYLIDNKKTHIIGKEEERAMFQQMQAMAQKQVSIKNSNLFSHTMRMKKNLMKVFF